MPSGQTQSLQMDLMAEGDNSKYTLFNDAITRLEDAFHRELAVDLTSGNHTLIESEITGFGIMVCSGHTVARELVVPAEVGSPAVDTRRTFFVKNDGTASGAVTVKHSAGGTTVVVAIGVMAQVNSDGTDMVLLSAVGGTLDALSDVDLSTLAPVDFDVFRFINGTAMWEPRSQGWLGINDQTGTTYTTVIGDAGYLIRLDNAAAIALTIPTNASVAYPLGTIMTIRQVGAGAVTIGGGGVTFNTPDDLVMLIDETAIITKVGTDEWDVTKDVDTISVPVPFRMTVAVSDETSTITTGTAKITFRMPAAVTLSDVRSSLTTTSSSGLPTVDINEDGATILSTKLSIDVGELTSTTADDAPVISDVNIADDAEITIDIDISGTGAAGLKVTFIGTYV